MIALAAYLGLSALLFAIGVYGLLTSRNGIKILICIELMLNAANINLVAFAAHYQNALGYVFAMFSIALAAAEAAVGLSILIALFRLKRRIDVSLLHLLKG
ncbi:MAG: NADH-quinone oxidoreductase subunit NuoK [Candidatus Bipolaricaulota bacterium]|nr:NADH-quinone oxidoreductase subunit NuoK [Candidatus Bipolaricaulota bacterium]MCS7274044.1 NADH-quinone oxidoreductase subunit NuoK [Candidatus Bipolaricaulota bacterium]MDW8031049.1 NADH-quinone oxidoreductase subunit NuoK [Candidatus Bipolaricaulota bacterium]